LLIQLVDLLTCKEGGDLGTREVLFPGTSIELLERRETSPWVVV
jgi:hypothetical protein